MLLHTCAVQIGIPGDSNAPFFGFVIVFRVGILNVLATKAPHSSDKLVENETDSLLFHTMFSLRVLRVAQPGAASLVIVTSF